MMFIIVVGGFVLLLGIVVVIGNIIGFNKLD